MSVADACPTFPNFDAGAVRGVAGWLSATAGTLRSVGTELGGILGGPDWSGDAHDHWVDQGEAGAGQFPTAGDAFSDASDALTTLAGEVEDQKEAFDRAYDNYFSALATMSGARSSLANYVPHGSPDIIEGDMRRLRQRINDAQADADRYLAQAWDAVDAALAAGRRASEALGTAADAATGLGGWAGFVGGPYPGYGSSPTDGPEFSFLVMLFGSIAANYAAGRAFQVEGMNRLGLTENFEAFVQRVGGRSVRTIPDAFGNGEMFEFKNGLYVYRSSQIQAQMAQAQQSGRGYTIVVGRNTRVAATLQAQVRVHPYGAEIVRMLPDGSYTTLDGRPVEQVSGGGWRYRDPDDQDQGGSASGGGGLNHPEGYEEDRISVDEYAELPENQSNMVPVVPLPLPMPMPIPMPAPAPMPMPMPLPIP
jgi:Restriction endonuclease fold toxin 7